MDEKELTSEEYIRILIMAFMGYIAAMERCSPVKAVETVSDLCARTQIEMGLGDKKIPRRGV